MHESQVIVLATPVFLLLIALECIAGWRRARAQSGSAGHRIYHLSDAVNSLSLGMMSQLGALFGTTLRIGIYAATWRLCAAWHADAFWNGPLGWLLALVAYDFCYYWLHRAGHEVGVLWAAHVVHHQSQDYNLSTALRQTSSGVLLGWLFYLPMAVAGVPPQVFAIVALVDLLYQFWVHTELVGQLGAFDRWFCSPSNHRVHHAVNDRYVDRNYGGMLMVWDHLFGTFQPEDPAEPCVYGTRKPLQSWDPLWANFEVYAALARDAWATRRWRDKLQVWLRPPGWRPDDVVARDPQAPFALAEVRRYDPVVSPARRRAGVALGVGALVGTIALLWWAPALDAVQQVLAALALCVALWGTGAVLQGRHGALWLAWGGTAAGSVLTAAAGLHDLHHVAKPLAMIWPLLIVARQPARDGQRWLLAALVAGLAGDILLMDARYFIAGLACFLAGHLAYLVLWRRGVPWFASRRALLATLATGAFMAAVLWQGGLPAALRGPVFAYIGVIALMAAQALGRAHVLQSRGALWSAAGACCFMLSDTLLALDRFVQHLPLAALWILSSYYSAQMLIVAGVLRLWSEPAQA